METYVVDTNVIIRFVTKDHPDHARRAYTLFQQVKQGTRRVTITEMVIAECVHVLSSKALYHLPRHEISARLKPIISLTGLRFVGKQVCQRALDLYATTMLDFVDCYLIALAERRNDARVMSFDRGYDRIAPGIRVEP